MLHPLALIVIVSIVVYDSFGPIAELGPGGALRQAAMFLAGFVLIAGAAHALLWLSGRRLDRRGDLRALRAAYGALSVSRWLTGAWFVTGVFAFDWIGEVRRSIGDWVGLDELIVVAPPLLAYAMGWWSFHPIDRRLHEALTLRRLDLGRTIHPMPTRLAYTLEKLRDTVIGGVAPLVVILLWSEALWWAAQRWEIFPWAIDDDRTFWAISGAQLLGAGLVLALSPPILMAIWNTSPLSEGPLHDRLAAMCRRHNVRCSAMRLWNTRGLTLNAAVVGVARWFRVVLLTDAIIENLPDEQLDAVMAHEIGHVRRRHLPWLLASLIAALGIAAWLLDLILEVVPAGGESMSDGLSSLIEATGIALAVAVALVWFSYVSRVFERQADAFSAADACGMTRNNHGAGLVVTDEAAQRLSNALGAVARLNHIPEDKFTWRHGSIADRRRRLAALVGRRVDQLPIDRTSRRIRRLIVVMLAVVIVTTVYDSMG